MRNTGKRHGAVLLELALVVTLFVPMLLGVIHFGYLFYLYNGLEKSVRDGARYAATRTYIDGRKADFERVIEAIVVCGSSGLGSDKSASCGEAGAGSPIVKGLELRANPTDPSKMVMVTMIPDAPDTRPLRVRVTIDGYQYRGVLSSVFDQVLPDGSPNPCGCLTLHGKPALEVPYLGRYVP
jgi:hypothetical protein